MTVPAQEGSCMALVPHDSSYRIPTLESVYEGKNGCYIRNSIPKQNLHTSVSKYKGKNL